LFQFQNDLLHQADSFFALCDGLAGSETTTIGVALKPAENWTQSDHLLQRSFTGVANSKPVLLPSGILASHKARRVPLTIHCCQGHYLQHH